MMRFRKATSGSIPLPAPQLNPKENLWDREKLQELRSQIHRCGARQAPEGDPLYPTQSRNRQSHHLIPLYRQVILMWKWYKNTLYCSFCGKSAVCSNSCQQQAASANVLFAISVCGRMLLVARSARHYAASVRRTRQRGVSIAKATREGISTGEVGKRRYCRSMAW
jgi:hypothetical protein